MSYREIIQSLEKELIDFPKKVFQTIEILTDDLDVEVATTPADIIYTEDQMKLLHYRPLADKEGIHPDPVLIVYALINRPIMLDLEPGRSFVQNLLSEGLDVYLIDWGYPTGADRFLDLDDYINDYLNKAVDRVRSESRREKINLMGVCMGGTMSVIYTALHAEKIKNLITLATPTDFDIDDAGLFLWAKEIDPDKVIEAFGTLPGDLANILYLLVVPVATVNKYIQFFEGAKDPRFVSTFLRMEKWIFDSPDMAGEVFREWIRDFLQKNLLIKNQLILNGQKVDLRKISCPLLNMYGEKDYLAPPSSARPLSRATGSKDVTTLGVDTGHVGIFVGSTSYKTIIPKIVKWMKAR